LNERGSSSCPMSGEATVRVPGTCGELAQGLLNGEHFHITCPIDLYAMATVDLARGSGRVVGPGDHPKACKSIELTLDFLHRKDLDARLALTNPLLPGKGMASSTADVAAAAYATGLAVGVDLSPTQIASIAVRVEPSDGLMFPGIALFDHREGKLLKLLGPTPAMRVLVLDFGGTVNTLAFNAIDRRAELQRLEPWWKEAVALITSGVSSEDAGLVGAGATLSTLAHQQILPKPQLEPVLTFAREVGAVGVNVAHSGTVLGVLFRDEPDRVERAASRARRELGGIEALYCRHLVDGGGAQVAAFPR